MHRKYRITYYSLITISIILYFIAVIAFAVWSEHDRKVIILSEIDKKLMMAACNVKYLLAPDFHDRAVDEKSISFKEEMKNRIMINNYTAETEFKWIYALLEKDGRFYFSAPAVSEQEAKERKSWYFYPYDDIPRGFVRAFNEKKTCYENYTDHWGTFRSIALPQTSPKGKVYLACADYDIKYLNALLRDNLIKSVLSSIYFALFSLPFIFIFRSFFRTYNIRLKKINNELKIHRDNLENLVNERTAELSASYKRIQDELKEKEIIEQNLREEKDRTSKALEEVKTLSGLLPICASCKKIRDDSGYWNQIEQYIQKHSDAKFTHGICPDCQKKFYPEL